LTVRGTLALRSGEPKLGDVFHVVPHECRGDVVVFRDVKVCTNRRYLVNLADRVEGDSFFDLSFTSEFAVRNLDASDSSHCSVCAHLYRGELMFPVQQENKVQVGYLGQIVRGTSYENACIETVVSSVPHRNRYQQNRSC